MTDTDTTKKNKPKKSKQTGMKKKLQELEEKSAEYLQGWQRAQADYQNLQKQSAAEKQALAEYIKAEVLKDFFPIIDHYYMAVEHIPEKAKDEVWVQGFVYLQKQFDQTLEAMGVERIETIGKQFDVETMEAVETKNDDQTEADTVLREVRAGYRLGDIVIVPAKVIVNS
ncbi:MAG: nucleotide exchange factor GrpE [Patescibacteria group bacterium]